MKLTSLAPWAPLWDSAAHASGANYDLLADFHRNRRHCASDVTQMGLRRARTSSTGRVKLKRQREETPNKENRLTRDSQKSLPFFSLSLSFSVGVVGLDAIPFSSEVSCFRLRRDLGSRKTVFESVLPRFRMSQLLTPKVERLPNTKALTWFQKSGGVWSPLYKHTRLHRAAIARRAVLI